MKRLLLILIVAVAVGFSACTKADFEDSYADPSKVSTTTVEKQFAGFMASNRWYVLPDYWNYFVVLRTTLNRYNQAVGWVNAPNQYVPGAAGITSRWDNYYNFLAQYRELENAYSKLPADEQQSMRIYIIAATIYFYDHTQKVVDLHGDIPWTEAGKLSANGGDYTKSLPKFDKAEDIYTKMLDDLKSFADELDNIDVKSVILTGFKNQDFLNNGNLNVWKKYTNSLRLRMLMRVSGVAPFQSRVTAETTAILGNPSKYPLVRDNADNIMIEVMNLSTEIHSKNFRAGLEDWDGNIAGKVMIDHMKANSDPRLRAMFEPGANAGGEYKGLDPLAPAATQTEMIAGGTLSIYNRSNLSRNQYFPGVLIDAAEVNFLVAEANLRLGNNAAANVAYNEGIKQSVAFYFGLRDISNDNTSGPQTPYTQAEVQNYIAASGVAFENAGTFSEKLKLIATQKWLHFSVVQPVESWSEIRRLNAPVFNFEVDNANAQKEPPYRWLYPSSEQTYNTNNYNEVKAKDNLSTRLFWDVN